MNHQDNTELGADRLRVWKDLRDRLRWSAGCDVIVRRLDLHDHVADATPYQERLVSLLAELADDLDR